jgi:hypothetical protein
VKQYGSFTPSVVCTPINMLLMVLTVIVAPARRGSPPSRWALLFRSLKTRTQIVQVVGVLVGVLLGVGVVGARLRISTGR